MRVLLVLSAAASSVAPPALMPLAAVPMRERGVWWERMAREAVAQRQRARRANAARTEEVELQECAVGLESRSQLGGTASPDFVICSTNAQAWCVVRPHGTWGRAAASAREASEAQCAPLRSSVVRVLLALSAAASSVAPSSLMSFSAVPMRERGV